MRERKRRKKGIYRGLLAGGLALCLFGGGFAAVNRYVFAAAHDKPVKLQASWQEPAAAAPQTVGYTKADYKVQVDPMYHATNSNAVSAEEAAEIGARYLWEVFGVDLKGYTLYMYYFMDPSRAIGYWYGDVITESGERHKAPYRFGIEAVSGEPESITRQDFPAEGKETILFKEEKIEEYYRANSDEYNELAKTYARKLLSAEPVKAEFLTTGALLAPGYDYEMPEGAVMTMEPEEKTADSDVILVPWGEEIPASYVYITILVTDAGGNQVQVEIDRSDKSLVSLSKQYNGVDYDPNSVG